MSLFKKKQEPKPTIEEVHRYMKDQFVEISQHMKDFDSRIVKLEKNQNRIDKGKQETPETVNRYLQIENGIVHADREIKALNQEIQESSKVINYRKEFNHLMPQVSTPKEEEFDV